MFKVRVFTGSDFEWAAEWSEDDVVCKAVGPLDQEWLHAVLNASDGVQLVVEIAGQPVGLLGAVWDPDGKRHVITDVAVDPQRRREGLGSSVLETATRWIDHPPARGWAAFVDPANRPARSFFRANGWRNTGQDDGLYRYISPPSPAHVQLTTSRIER